MSTCNRSDLETLDLDWLCPKITPDTNFKVIQAVNGIYCFHITVGSTSLSLRIFECMKLDTRATPGGPAKNIGPTYSPEI